MDQQPATFGELVRRRRLAATLTQAELARRAGMSIRAVRDIESGRVSRPRNRSAQRLADACGIGPHERAALVTDLDRSIRDRLEIGILGPLSIRAGITGIEVKSRMQRDIVGLLALHLGELVSGDEIVEVLWSDQPPKTWRSQLQDHIGRLRARFEPQRPRRTSGQVIEASRGGYRLLVEQSRLDLGRFGDLARRAREATACGDIEAALTSFGQALGCWRGPVLADAGPRLQQHLAAIAAGRGRLTVALAAADLAIAQNRYPLAADWLGILAAEEPLHEGLYARLLVALNGCGQQAEAIRLYGGIRARLADELGVAPSSQLASAYLSILRQPASAVPDESKWSDGSKPLAQLPADIAAFTGRIGQLRFMDELLEAMDGSLSPAITIIVIDGMAGIGKTALAVHWAHQVAERFPDGQLYVNLRGFDPSGNAVSPGTVVHSFLDAFGVPPHRIPADPQAREGLYRSLLAGRRILILLDNARDAEQVRPLLPGSAGCLVLVTSRNELSGLVAAHSARSLRLGPLSAADSGDLLAQRIGDGRVAAEPAAVRQIVTRCSGLPLALAIVAARAATRPDFPLDVLAEQLRQPNQGLDVFAGTDPATDLTAVFSWSYQALAPAAARLFRLLGLHPGPDITAPAAASLAAHPVPQARSLLADLAQANLLTEHLPGRHTFHDLVRGYAADLVTAHDSDQERRAALTRVLDHYAYTAHAADRILRPHRDPVDLLLTSPAPGTRPEPIANHQQAMAWLTTERPVLLAAVRQAADTGFDAHTCQLVWALDAFLDRQGHWSDLVAACRAALDAACRLGNLNAQAITHRFLAGAHTLLGHHADAHAHLEQALDLYRTLGDHIGQAQTELNLASLWDRQARPESALCHAQRSLDLYHEAGHRRGHADALNAVGWCYAQLDDHRQALNYCAQALTLLQQLNDRAGEAAAWDSLGYAHEHLGHCAEAIACYQHAVDMSRDLGARYDEAESLAHLGDVHHTTGDLAAARTAWQQALAILDELDHPDTAQLRAKLAGLSS